MREEIALSSILLRDLEDKEEHAPLASRKNRKNRLSYLTQSVGHGDAAPSLESDLRERTILVSGASSVPQITSTYENKSIDSLLFL